MSCTPRSSAEGLHETQHGGTDGGLRATHDALPTGTRVLVQTSAHGEPVGAVLDGTTLHLDVARPRVAPGQEHALYDGERVVAGGYAA